MKLIFSGMTFLSLVLGPCLGNSSPLKLGEWERVPSQGRSATMDGFLNKGDTSLMYFTTGRETQTQTQTHQHQASRCVGFLCFHTQLRLLCNTNSETADLVIAVSYSS